MKPLMGNEERKIRRKVLAIALGLLIAIMSFTGFVNYMTFAANYNQALVRTYSVAGDELVRKIEYALGYGKPIDNYYGMQDTLKELQGLIPELERAAIVSPGGEVLYDINGFVRDSRLTDDLLEAAVFRQGLVKENLSWRFYQDGAYIFSGISDQLSGPKPANPIASLMMVFPDSVFLQASSPLAGQLGAWLAGIALIALAVLSVIFFRSRLFDRDTFSKKKLLLVFMIVIGGAQLCCTGVNYFLFKDSYTDMAYKSRDFIQTIVTRNMEDIYAKGLSPDNITGLDEYLSSITESLPQIAGISMAPLEPGSQVSAHQVRVAVSDDYVRQQIHKVLLDMLTVLVISVFFMTELALLAVFVSMAGGPTRAVRRGLRADAGPVLTGHASIRSLIFFVNLGACMSLTFVPIVMQALYQPVLGLPRDVVLGLPLSAEMLGGILAIFIAGRAIHKRGWRLIFYLGILLLAAGNLLAGLSTDGLVFITARAIAGLGLGHILMAIRSLVVSLPEPNAAIAEFSAGSIAGLSCGLVVGGMLADRIGYWLVFYVAAALVIIPVILVRRFLTGLEIRERKRAPAGIKFVRFMTDRKALLFLTCLFLPYFISGAFLDYYFPLFASAHGLSQSDISRGFLLNGLFIIYLGPVLTGYASEKLGSVKAMILSMAIVIGALITFMVFGTVPAALAAIALLGIAESFGVSLQTTYFLNLPGIRDLTINQGIAWFSGLVNAGRMAGPMIYGLALALGTRMGIGAIALGLLGLLAVFIFSVRAEPADTKRG